MIDTFDELIVDMKRSAESMGMRAPAISSMLEEYAKDLKEAHEREIAEKDEKIAFLKRGIDQMDTNCNRLKERIALLEKALKPVIEINLEGLTKFEGIDCEKLLTAIVADAQQIMKEGEK